ncbi:MAG: tetratricopeptide repeat protein [Rickettsiales bacterium]|nr:tetratricopeptide repeat protein [Rickettsiales bacterium]
MADLDLLDEVQEDLKEERYGRIVSRLTRVFLVIAAVTLVATSVYVWRDNASTKLQNKLSVLFNKALLAVDNNNLDESIVYFDQIIQHPKEQYAALAYLQKAAVLVKQNKFEEAQKELLEMSNNKNFEDALRELAQVIFLGNQLQMNDLESPVTSEMLDRLVKNNNIWQLSALQMKALYDLKQNNIEDARIALKEIISSNEASKYSQDTASSILSVISRSK